MKKVLSLLLCLVLIFIMPQSALASGELKIDVLAKYVYRTGLPEFPVEDGGGKLPDGTEIQITNPPPGAKILVVRKIPRTDTAPYVWFSQVLTGQGSLLQAYEIYFLDASYQRLSANGTRITITVPTDMNAPRLWSILPDGNFQALTNNIKTAKVTFTANTAPYYVFAAESFEDYRDKILEEIDGKHEPGEDDVRDDRIDEAYKDAEDYKYDPDKSFDENKEALDKILQELEKDLEDLEKFEDYRDEILDMTDGLHKPGESPSRKEEIDKIYQQIKDYDYDFDKTLKENKDAIYKLMDSLCKDLGVETPKTSDQFRMELWLTLSGISLLLLLLLLLWRKKKKDKE